MTIIDHYFQPLCTKSALDVIYSSIDHVATTATHGEKGLPGGGSWRWARL